MPPFRRRRSAERRFGVGLFRLSIAPKSTSAPPCETEALLPRQENDFIQVKVCSILRSCPLAKRA